MDMSVGRVVSWSVQLLLYSSVPDNNCNQVGRPTLVVDAISLLPLFRFLSFLFVFLHVCKYHLFFTFFFSSLSFIFIFSLSQASFSECSVSLVLGTLISFPRLEFWGIR